MVFKNSEDEHTMSSNNQLKKNIGFYQRLNPFCIKVIIIIAINAIV